MKLGILTLALLFLGACVEDKAPAKSPAAAVMLQSATSTCAFGVPQTAVVYHETPTGAALDFLTPPDRVEDLRARAVEAAAGHGPGARLGKGHDGKHGDGGEHGLKTMQMPPADMWATPLPGGAEIVFIPVDPSDRDKLREKLIERAAAMVGGCAS